jgi:predicted metalloprotease with PDZ domain
MYVDDLLSGGWTVEQAKTRKEISREILQDATFELHKWSSNVPQLEVDEVHQVSELSDEQSYAKTQLMVKPKESKVLGLKWDKQSDTLKISFPSEEVPATKRGILSKLAKIYDPLGLVS